MLPPSQAEEAQLKAERLAEEEKRLLAWIEQVGLLFLPKSVFLPAGGAHVKRGGVPGPPVGGRRQQVTEAGLGHHDGDLLKALRSGEVLVRYGYLLLLLLLLQLAE